MIPEAVFREFPAETRRKHSVSSWNPSGNARNLTQESGDRIWLPVLPCSCRFRTEPDISCHRTRSPASMRFPELSGTDRFQAGLCDLGSDVFFIKIKNKIVSSCQRIDNEYCCEKYERMVKIYIKLSL
jgi:hypothetical protein